jgi:hypothetical protein
MVPPYNKIYTDNQYFLFQPAAPPPGFSKSPVIFQIYGSAWTMNHNWDSRPFRYPTPAIQNYNQHGIAFLSLGFRVLDRQYWYLDSQGQEKREELIHIDDAGNMTLDTTGKTMQDYQVVMCHLEMLTKVMYDSIAALEHLILHADELNVDIHKITFLGSSSGSSTANYLSFAYHALHVGRFTPIGMMLAAPQFNNPILCASNFLWRDFLAHYEDPNLKASTLLDYPPGAFGLTYKSGWCRFVIECPTSAGVTCNATFNALMHARYCASEALFNTVTVAELNNSQIWNRSIPGYGKGLEKLWLTGKNMLNHVPKPFHILLQTNPQMENILHHPMFVQQFAEIGDRAGIDYTVYYHEYPGMRQDLPPLKNVKEQETLAVPGMGNYRYASSKGWRSAFPAIKAMAATDIYGPHLPFVCLLAGITSCKPVAAVPATAPALYELHALDMTEQSHGYSVFALFAAAGAFSLLSVLSLLWLRAKWFLAEGSGAETREGAALLTC